MIESLGSLWDAQRADFIPAADAICITTNGSIRGDGCGVMGRGCARQAAVLYPGIARNLGEALTRHGNHVQILMPAEQPVIVSYPVKPVWADRADGNLILRSAFELSRLADLLQWTRVVLPRPGCGNGQMLWVDVRELIAPILDDRFEVRFQTGYD